MSPTRHLQRRLSVLLSMVMCLWMLATATHFHIAPDDQAPHHSAKELCGFCASLPGAAAAPAVRTFVPIHASWQITAPAMLLPEVAAVAPASYRSRAPPLV